VKQFATQYPKIKFAITDDTVANVGGLPNEEGITYAAQESGCLVGVLAAKQAKSMGASVWRKPSSKAPSRISPASSTSWKKSRAR
jgi:basic membrane lipoprotein Med (substrate-binding protein (PBP1-ABC) superfamily)